MQAPAWGPSSDYLRLTLAPLLVDRLRVVTFDPRNTGKSTRSPAPRSQAASRLVEDLECVRRHFDIERFVVVGHSHGGFVAMAYAVRHPRRLRALIVLTTALRNRAAAADRDAILDSLPAGPQREQAVELVRAGEALSVDDVANDRELARWLRRRMAASFFDLDALTRFQRQLGRSALPSTDALRGMPREREVWVEEGLRDVDVPALIVAAAHDPVTPPSESERIHRLIRSSELAIINRAGHNPWVERPRETGRVVNAFLDRLPD